MLIGGAALAECAVVHFESGPRVSGRLGYSVLFPKGFTGLRDERDNGTDTVAAWPAKKKVGVEDIGDLKKLETLGIVIMNVYPRSLFPMDPVDWAENSKRKMEAEGMGWVDSVKDFPAGTGYLISAVGPELGFTQAIVAGRENTFEFLASDLEGPLLEMLKSLKEGGKAGPSSGPSKKIKPPSCDKTDGEPALIPLP